MDRIEIESEFRTSKMADVSHFVKNFQNKKLRIDLKWPEMRSKVKFGNPKWPTSAILSKISKKVKFGHPKMADISHFVKNFKKNLKLRIDVKWIEMRSKVIFGHPKWSPAAILSKIFKKKKSSISILNGHKCDQK